MNINRFAVLLIIIFVMIIGCSENYGTIRIPSGNDDKITLAELKENWEEYTVYQGYRWATRPAAIMFDPKGDDKKLVGDSWYLIEDQEALSQSIREIQDWFGIDDDYPLGLIEGPDNEIWGYIWPAHRVPVRMVDERTLYVSRLPEFGSAP